ARPLDGARGFAVTILRDEAAGRVARQDLCVWRSPRGDGQGQRGEVRRPAGRCGGGGHAGAHRCRAGALGSAARRLPRLSAVHVALGVALNCRGVRQAEAGGPRLTLDNLTQPILDSVKGWTVAQLREHVLDASVSGPDLLRLSRGLSSEMIAACAKLMSNLDL